MSPTGDPFYCFQHEALYCNAPGHIPNYTPDAEIVADTVHFLRDLFSVERIAVALHERMVEAIATFGDTHVEPCGPDCHFEEAKDLREPEHRPPPASRLPSWVIGDIDRPLNCCGSISGHLPTCETLR